MSCPDCFSGSVHTHAEPQGKIETVHGIRTYIAGGSDDHSSKSAILYLPDAFSLKLVNNLLLADQYASRTGCRVLIPDLVYNGGIEPHVLPLMEELMEPAASWSIAGVFWKVVAGLRALPHVVPFLLFGHPKNVYPRILAYARAMRADLPDGGKLGVAGFCWGGWGATKLCAEPKVEEAGGERLIDAQFNAHPSFIIDTPEMVVEAITKFKVPYASAVAEEDFQFNAAAAAKTEAKVREAISAGGSSDAYIYDFKIYKGCKHGFGVRARQDAFNMDGYQDALTQAAAWFNKYLN